MLSKLFFSEAIKILSNFVCYIFKGCSQFICIGVSNFSKGAKMQILSIAYLVIEHTCKFPGALLCIHTVLEPQHPQAVSYNRPPCLKKKKKTSWHGPTSSLPHPAANLQKWSWRHSLLASPLPFTTDKDTYSLQQNRRHEWSLDQNNRTANYRFMVHNKHLW